MLAEVQIDEAYLFLFVERKKIICLLEGKYQFRALALLQITMWGFDAVI